MDDQRDQRLTAQPQVPSDDDLGALVRDLAEEWRMPPQRLDEPTWRDRVRSETEARRATPARWAVRASRALGAAVLATALLALVAVVLTLPRSTPAGPGGSAAAVVPGGTSSRTTSPAAESPAPSNRTATPLPLLERTGPLPSPSRLVVSSGSAYQVLDLSSGTLGAPFAGSVDTYSPLLARQGGGYVLLATAAYSTPPSDGVRVTVRTYDAQGRPVASFVPGGTGGIFVGRVDPAVSGPAADQGSSAAIDGSLSLDGRALYLGWTERVPPVWRSGVDVVDMTSGALIQTIRLPDVASSQSGGAIYAWAPHVVEAPDARHVVIDATVVEPATGVSAWWSAPLSGGLVGALTAFATGAGTLDACAGNDLAEGFATPDSYFALCGASGAPVVLRRVDLVGSALGDTSLPGLSAGPLPGQVAVVVDRTRGVLYAWGPFSATLVRVELRSGTVTGTATLPPPAAESNGALGSLGSVLGRIGRWLAPAAAAKMYLQPAIALSPDGTRLYALGVNGTSPIEAGAGSSGVWVFDATSLAIVGHWVPTADYISVAVSADGAVVYAAGMAGVDASGAQGSQQASVTAFDAASGSIRVIAGQLGDAFLDLSPGLSLAYP